MFAYLEKYNLELESHFTSLLGKHTRRPWTRFVNAENQHLACPEAIDLIDKMLVYDHCERILPREAMRHPYFQPVLVGLERRSSGERGPARPQSSFSLLPRGRLFLSVWLPGRQMSVHHCKCLFLLYACSIFGTTRWALSAKETLGFV